MIFEYLTTAQLRSLVQWLEDEVPVKAYLRLLADRQDLHTRRMVAGATKKELEDGGAETEDILRGRIRELTAIARIHDDLLAELTRRTAEEMQKKPLDKS